MRRIPRTTAGVNPVKDKQQELTRSVNSEQFRLESLQEQVKAVSTDIELIIEKRDGAAQDLEDKQSKVDQIKIELINLTNEKNSLTAVVQSAQGDLKKAQDELSDAKQQAKTVLQTVNEESQRVVDSARTKVDAIIKQLADQQTLLDSITHEYGRKKVELDRVISETQTEMTILRKLNQDVVDRKRDLANLVSTIAGREDYLSTIQITIRQSEITKFELDQKIKLANQSLADITELVNKKKAEKDDIDQRLIAVTKREVQVKKVGEKIKALYDKSGIPIDLEL